MPKVGVDAVGEAWALGVTLHLAGFNGQGQAMFRSNFKAKLDRFFDIFYRFFSRRTLANTA